MPNTAPVTSAAAATSAGLSMPEVVMALPVATVVPTVEANPHTMAGRTLSSLSFDACTMAALPMPTHTAAAIGVAARSGDREQRQRGDHEPREIRRHALHEPGRTAAHHEERGPRDERHPHGHGKNGRGQVGIHERKHADAETVNASGFFMSRLLECG